jgi:hypothetical protein
MFKNQKLFANDDPAALCSMLDGKIYETDDISAFADAQCAPLHLTERQESGRTITRFCTDNRVAHCASVPPNLEDLFLYVYRDEAV